MNLPPPPHRHEPEVFRRPEEKRRPWGILPVLLLGALIVGVLVWGAGKQAPTSHASRTPAPTPVVLEPQALTQAGADAAAGAILVAWHDVKHLDFVVRDIHRVTRCAPLAFEYVGPFSRTNPNSIPKDIQPDIVGRAHTDTERMTVWFDCKEVP